MEVQLMSANPINTSFIKDEIKITLKEITDLIQIYLENENFTVYKYYSSQDVLRNIDDLKIDLAILDVMMPDMDGYEVCLRLKNNPLTTKIPVIFVTAKNQELDEIRGFALGAVDYITKPINSVIAKIRIRTHLALSDTKKNLEIEIKEKTKELYETRLEIIHKLSKAAEYRDDATGHHIERVSTYSYVIAKEYGLDESECETILNAAPMHDIGKIGIPDYILKKPGKLSYEEFDINEKPRRKQRGIYLKQSHLFFRLLIMYFFVFFFFSLILYILFYNCFICM